MKRSHKYGACYSGCLRLLRCVSALSLNLQRSKLQAAFEPSGRYEQSRPRLDGPIEHARLQHRAAFAHLPSRTGSRSLSRGRARLSMWRKPFKCCCRSFRPDLLSSAACGFWLRRTALHNRGPSSARCPQSALRGAPSALRSALSSTFTYCSIWQECLEVHDAAMIDAAPTACR